MLTIYKIAHKKKNLIYYLLVLIFVNYNCCALQSIESSSHREQIIQEEYKNIIQEEDENNLSMQKYDGNQAFICSSDFLINEEVPWQLQKMCEQIVEAYKIEDFQQEKTWYMTNQNKKKMQDIFNKSYCQKTLEIIGNEKLIGDMTDIITKLFLQKEKIKKKEKKQLEEKMKEIDKKRLNEQTTSELKVNLTKQKKAITKKYMGLMVEEMRDIDTKQLKEKMRKIKKKRLKEQIKNELSSNFFDKKIELIQKDVNLIKEKILTKYSVEKLINSVKINPEKILKEIQELMSRQENNHIVEKIINQESRMKSLMFGVIPVTSKEEAENIILRFIKDKVYEIFTQETKMEEKKIEKEDLIGELGEIILQKGMRMGKFEIKMALTSLKKIKEKEQLIREKILQEYLLREKVQKSTFSRDTVEELVASMKSKFIEQTETIYDLLNSAKNKEIFITILKEHQTIDILFQKCNKTYEKTGKTTKKEVVIEEIIIKNIAEILQNYQRAIEIKREADFIHSIWFNQKKN